MRLRLRSVLRAGALAALVLACAARPALSTPDPRGIFVYSEHLATDSLQLAQALALPGVDGVTLLQGWASLEPSRGTYHWSTLDGWIGLASSLGRKVVLAIRAGQDTPCWLFQSPECGAGSGKAYAGATPLRFLVSARQGIGQSSCDTTVIAAPWDPVFTTQWDSLLVQLAAHLKKVGEYDAVIGLRLTGINRTTAELRLPEEILTTPCVTNAITTWLDATPAYRPDSALSAWDRITDSFLSHFSDRVLGLELVPDDTGNGSYPFPEIDANGCVYTSIVPPGEVPGACFDPAPLPDQVAPFVQLAAAKFSGRLTLSFQNLDSLPANPYVVNAAQTYHTWLGFQTNDYDSLERAACSGGSLHPGKCDSASYLALLDVGIYPLGPAAPMRSQYIEVLPTDALAFPWSILQAHDQLFASGTTAAPESDPSSPIEFDLRPNRPNPFSRSTAIRYRLPQRVHVTVSVFNVLGARVAVLVDGEEEAGEHEVRFEAAALTSGVYFYSVHAGDRVERRKFTLLR